MRFKDLIDGIKAANYYPVKISVFRHMFNVLRSADAYVTDGEIRVFANEEYGDVFIMDDLDMAPGLFVGKNLVQIGVRKCSYAEMAVAVLIEANRNLDTLDQKAMHKFLKSTISIDKSSITKTHKTLSLLNARYWVKTLFRQDG